MSELAQAIEEMRNMRESYDQLAATADLYQQGRAALAAAITDKGVPTTAATPLAEMAENVGDIQQVTTVIDGGDMYAAQLFGDGTLWNLYDVLAQMKSQWLGAGHYAALIVCEYYKGYDSLLLQGADAYYTCDGDFYDYASPNHVWHDDNNGKMNRWVCFLYRDEGARLDITNTDISPRSMYIGGHIGTIEYFVNGRLTELVCGIEETDVVDNFSGLTYSQSFAYKAILRNAFIKKGSTLNNGGFVLVETKAQDLQTYELLFSTNAQYCEINLKENFTLTRSAASLLGVTANNQIIKINGQIYGAGRVIVLLGHATNTTTKIVDVRGYTGGGNILLAESGGTYFEGLIDLIVGSATRSFSARIWRPNYLSDIDKKAQLINNIKNHILARVSDATGGTQLVFTVSTNMYNVIATENIEWQGETMTLADAFLTKNWLLAGA